MRTPSDALRALFVWAALLVVPALAQTFPALTGRVVDQAGVLSPATEAQLTQRLAALEARNGAQLVVATVRSLEDHEIRDYGYRLGRAWGIGQQGRNNGAILLVAPNDRQVAVEVGYGLEPVLTDAYANRLLDQQVIPRFKAGDLEGGVVAGTDALITQIGLEPGEAQARIAAADARPNPA
ncbi:MAG: TPM domain-containing protein, partial [Proteobacteria bacterium]|nr:TPM domain-containing protein [Pseudomonadota bacterium]